MALGAPSDEGALSSAWPRPEGKAPLLRSGVLARNEEPAASTQDAPQFGPTSRPLACRRGKPCRQEEKQVKTSMGVALLGPGSIAASAATEPSSSVSALRVTIPNASKQNQEQKPAGGLRPRWSVPRHRPVVKRGPPGERGRANPAPAGKTPRGRRAGAAPARPLRQGWAAPVAGPKRPAPGAARPRSHAALRGWPVPVRLVRRPHDGAMPGNRPLPSGGPL